MDEETMLAALTGTREDRVAAIRRLLVMAWQRGFRDSTAQWVEMLAGKVTLDERRNMEANAAIEYVFPPERMQ